MVCIPACAHDAGATAIPIRHLQVSDADETLVALLAETIVPTTDTPGAKALNLHQFVLRMLDDCYDPAGQERLRQGMGQLEGFTRQRMGGAFSALSPEHRLALLRTIRDEATAPAELRYFVNEVRRWTIRGFETSQYVLTQVHPYELVPGRWDGCKKIANV